MRGWRGEAGLLGADIAQRGGEFRAGDVLDPGFVIGLAPVARGLQQEQGAHGAVRLAEHAGGLGLAFQHHDRIEVRCAGAAQGIHRPGAGGDEMGGELGLGGVDRTERGDLADGGAVAIGTGLGRVGGGRGHEPIEPVEELAVGGLAAVMDGIEGGGGHADRILCLGSPRQGISGRGAVGDGGSRFGARVAAGLVESCQRTSQTCGMAAAAIAAA